MDLIANLHLGFAAALTPESVLYCFIGALLGTAIGVLPGIGATATIALLLPITLTLSPLSAIIMRIVLPQVLVNVSPGILNVLTVIVKETSLGYMVGVGELTLTASHVNSLTLTKPLQVFALLSIIYFTICFGISRLVRLLEMRVGTQAKVAA